MRLDLYLKASCIVKRRAFAKTLCDEGCVSVNGKPAKAGRDVEVGDEIAIQKRQKLTRLKVLELPLKSYAKARARECYELVEGQDEGLDGTGPEE